MQKEYKVVCSKTKAGDIMYIDIAPSSGNVHDQIFFSRIQIHKNISNQPIHRVYGSIYIQDNDGVINILFPKEMPSEQIETQKKYNINEIHLSAKIMQQYKKMRAAGKESTLFVYDIDSMFENNISAEEAKKADSTGGYLYKNKHKAKLEPQTLQEEELANAQMKNIRAQERRVAVEQKRATESMPSWLKFQKEYSGD